MFRLATVLILHEFTSFLSLLHKFFAVRIFAHAPFGVIMYSVVSDLLLVPIIALPPIMTNGLDFRKGKRVPNNGHMTAFASTEFSSSFDIAYAYVNIFSDHLKSLRNIRRAQSSLMSTPLLGLILDRSMVCVKLPSSNSDNLKCNPLSSGPFWLHVGGSEEIHCCLRQRRYCVLT